MARPPNNGAMRLTPYPRLEGRVLVVDDEELVRQSLCRVIGLAGLETMQAERGDEALELLTQLSETDRSVLKAVILDLSLPGISGADLLGRIRQLWPALPVVVLSGHIPREDQVLAATIVLEKPIGATLLLETLAQIINGQA